jgi:hypothetical protein
LRDVLGGQLLGNIHVIRCAGSTRFCCGKARGLTDSPIVEERRFSAAYKRTFDRRGPEGPLFHAVTT